MKRFVLQNERTVTACLDYISSLPEKPVMAVEIKQYREKRTLEQNAQLHVLFDAISAHTGFSPEQAKEQTMRHLGYVEQREFAGEMRDVRKETSKMEIPEMSRLISDVLAFCADFDIPTLPDA